MADGGDESFLPPFDEILKADTNKDQRIQREEMKGNPDAYEHFWDGWTEDMTGQSNVPNSTSSATQPLNRHGLTAVRLAGTGDLTASNVAVTKSYPAIPAPLIYQAVN